MRHFAYTIAHPMSEVSSSSCIGPATASRRILEAQPLETAVAVLPRLPHFRSFIERLRRRAGKKSLLGHPLCIHRAMTKVLRAQTCGRDLSTSPQMTCSSRCCGIGVGMTKCPGWHGQCRPTAAIWAPSVTLEMRVVSAKSPFGGRSGHPAGRNGVRYSLVAKEGIHLTRAERHAHPCLPEPFRSDLSS